MTAVTAYIPAYHIAEYLPHSVDGLLRQTVATYLRHDNTRSIAHQAYPSGIKLRSLTRTARFIHFRFNFLDQPKADRRAGRFDLLALGYRDFRLWLASSAAAARQRSAAGV